SRGRFAASRRRFYSAGLAEDCPPDPDPGPLPGWWPLDPSGATCTRTVGGSAEGPLTARTLALGASASVAAGASAVAASVSVLEGASSPIPAERRLEYTMQPTMTITAPSATPVRSPVLEAYFTTEVAISSETRFMTLISGLIAGPAVSLNGS